MSAFLVKSSQTKSDKQKMVLWNIKLTFHSFVP